MSTGWETLQSFAPSYGKPELLEKVLIGRTELVDEFEHAVLDGAGGANKHQRLIVGVRGSGKTHVLRVLHNRLWANEALKKRILIVYLLEDELGVASFLDLVVRMLRAIVRWYPEQKELSRNLRDFYEIPLESQEARATSLLLDAAADRDILVLTENLGIIFDNKKGFGLKGQQKLRNLVQQHPRFMIFASSQALVEGVRNHDAPFFGFFKTIHLRRLTVEQAMVFLMAIASATGRQDVVSFLKIPKGRARMRAVFDFTGGNHRLLVNFFEFLIADSVAELSTLFIQALNPLKPYYQEQMRSLSAQQQKIVQYLCLERTPRSVKEIARGCLAAPNTISRQLKDLLDMNFVSKSVQGRESYYELTEALFRICYETDLEQEGAPVRLFVDFLANLYTTEEFKKTIELGADLSTLLNSRGESRRLSSKYPEALADYEEASRVDPKAAIPQLNIVSVLLAMGRIDDALDRLLRALRIESDNCIKQGLLIGSFQENTVALFELAPTHSFGRYVDNALDILEDAEYLERFEASIPVTVFELLKKHDSISEKRFERIVQTFKENFSAKIDTRVAVRFLEVGVEYFQKVDTRALLRLTREERQMFCKRLGIEKP